MKWDAHRQWRFNTSLRHPRLLLLRDHITLFADLGKDWATGPPSDYYTWTPITYAVDFDMRNYELNLYVNDHNIIDKPQLREENGEYHNEYKHCLLTLVLLNSRAFLERVEFSE